MKSMVIHKKIIATIIKCKCKMKNANVIQMLQLRLLPGGPQLGSNGVFLVRVHSSLGSENGPVSA
jgi:hypothetical protein